MSIPDPRESRHSSNDQCDIGEHAKSQNGIRLNVAVHEIANDFEQNPYDPRSSTSTVDTTQVLKDTVRHVYM